ncbi:MAG: PAS domain-containing sensor histidine kinase, partial [Thermoanaerobaculia bacterium]
EIVLDRQGEMRGMMGILHNVTERRVAEAALRVSQERLAKAFQASPDAIVISSVKDGRILEANNGFFNISGHRVEDSIGKNAHELDLWYHPEDRIKLVNALKEEGFVRGMECIIRHKRGHPIICDLSAELIDLEGEPYFVTVTRDITTKRKADAELEASRQELRELTARLQAIREEERTVMSREIHDELGQSLTALKLDLSWLHGKLPADNDILLDRTNSMLALTSSTLESVRELASRLRPAILDDLGLAAAIEWQAGEFAPRAGIECTLDLSIADLPPDPERDTEVFRIIQESLTNVARHAKASRVEIGMHRNDDHLIVSIKDDGKGIPVGRLAGTQSLGLLGMRERAKTLEGTLEVTRRLSGGTLITLTLPYNRLRMEEVPQ